MNLKSILVIEDHESIRKIIGRFLSRYYQVVTKADGLEGLAYLNQGNFPDLIILDMTMPRINGLEFLSNIRSSGFFRHIPIVIVSGEENNKLIEKCQQLGISGFVAKPFNPFELKEKIHSTLSNSGTNPSAVA
ncbi:MAG: response regulator [Bacteroidota bacterium]